MAGREARTFAEGSVRWVQASGTGVAWATASAPASATIGYVQEGMTVTSGRTVTPVMERGITNHFKVTEETPIKLTLNYLQAVTGNWPPTTTTAVGASVPAVHLEWKQSVPELGGGTAEYYQFIHCVLESRNPAEAAGGNTVAETWVCRGMVGPTGSGYLA